MSPHENQEMLTTLPPIQGIHFEQNVSVPMHDGVHLKLNVFCPEQQARYPVILSVSPYGKDQLPTRYDGSRRGVDMGSISTSPYAAFEALDPAYWVPKGYVVLHGNVRGMWNSGGTGQ